MQLIKLKPGQGLTTLLLHWVSRDPVNRTLIVAFPSFARGFIEELKRKKSQAKESSILYHLTDEQLEDCIVDLENKAKLRLRAAVHSMKFAIDDGSYALEKLLGFKVSILGDTAE